MTENFGKATGQAWSAYYALKHEASMTWMQARQTCSNLEAALDYLAKARAEETDADVLEVYAEATADTQECYDKMKVLYDSLGDDGVADASQYRGWLKLLYWL